MEDIKIQRNKILQLMKDVDVRKAMGSDEVAGWILRKCAEQQVDLIHDIKPCSLNTGKLPDEWKRAHIVPVYTKGDRKEKKKNTQLQPNFPHYLGSKICKNIIRKKWTKFLEKNKLIPKQFRFGEGSFCVTNLLSYYSSDRHSTRKGRASRFSNTPVLVWPFWPPGGI